MLLFSLNIVELSLGCEIPFGENGRFQLSKPYMLKFFFFSCGRLNEFNCIEACTPQGTLPQKFRSLGLAVLEELADKQTHTHKLTIILLL